MDGKVIFLLGPTASGKTDMSLELARRFPVEIISVDSAQVYRHMDIGTAKPDAETLSRFPHHLIDLIEPTEAYSAARFCEDALVAISSAHAAGKVPLLAGGTMLYAKALLQGLSKLPTADPALRALLEARARAIGWPAMHAELAQHDPVAAKRLKPNDAQRVQRALEVWHLSGTAMSTLQATGAGEHRFPYPALILGLMPTDRARLHDRISQRFSLMLRRGLADELAGLRRNFALLPDMPSMRCVGYRQAWEFLEGRLDAGGLQEKGVAATRQLAKRQMTWLRSMQGVELLDGLSANAQELVLARCASFLGT